MSEQQPTPERPDPPLETPDLSLVSTIELLEELYERSTNLIVGMQYRDEGDAPMSRMWSKGDLSTQMGMLTRLRRQMLKECDRRDDSGE